MYETSVSKYVSFSNEHFTLVSEIIPADYFPWFKMSAPFTFTELIALIILKQTPFTIQRPIFSLVEAIKASVDVF